MMRNAVRLLVPVAVAGFAAAAQATDNLPTLNTAPYLTGRAPAGFGGHRPPAVTTQKAAAESPEKAAAINGALYAVIAPTYNNPAAAMSYIRLFNGAPGASNFSINIIGSPSGNSYGVTGVLVRRSASLQFSLTQILQRANITGLSGGDTSFSLYIQNPDPMTGYQHVVYNAVSKFFENASVCASLLNQAVASNTSSAVLTNVHTSLIPNYPAQIELHNFWNAAVTYRMTVIDSETGNVINAMNVPTQPNASYSIPMSEIESQLGWQPSPWQFHVNLVVTDPSGGPPYNLLGQTIVNQQLTANVSMGTACAVNSSNTSYSGGPGLNGY